MKPGAVVPSTSAWSFGKTAAFAKMSLRKTRTASSPVVESTGRMVASISEGELQIVRCDLWLDLDGTLVDSRPAMEQAFAMVLDDHAREVRRALDLDLSVWWFRHPAEMATHLRLDDVETFASRVNAAFRESAALASPQEGVVEALRELDRVGTPLSVLTQQPRSRAEVLLSRLDCNFSRLVTNEGRGLDKGFVLSDVATSASGRCSVAYVGDSVADIEASRAAGVEAAAVAWGYTARASLRRACPDHLLEHGSDLLMFGSR